MQQVCTDLQSKLYLFVTSVFFVISENVGRLVVHCHRDEALNSNLQEIYYLNKYEISRI